MAALLRVPFFGSIFRTSRRTYLSSSYLCDDHWSKMLSDDPLINKTQQDKLFTELMTRYNTKLPVGAIDVDVFSHKTETLSHLDELEYILVKFRRTRRCVDILDSTHHAVCRSYLKLNCHDRLLPLLEKRIEYGIFPDDYIYNALMDYYLTQDKITEAFRVACLYMLQENYENEITRSLSLLSALKWLTSSPVSEDTSSATSAEPAATEETEVATKEEEEEDDEDAEPEYIRIPFLRNEYNDNHFDLKDEKVLCGKVFHYIGLREGNPLGINMQILGQCLTKNYSQASSLLNLQSDKSAKLIASDLSSLINSHCPPEEPQVAQLCESLRSFTSSVTLHRLTDDRVCDVSKLQVHEMKQLQDRMKSWQVDRQFALDAHLHNLTRDELIKEIRTKRSDLTSREKMLYFFENLDKIEMELRDAEATLESLKNKSIVEEDYVPPTVAQSFTTITK